MSCVDRQAIAHVFCESASLLMSPEVPMRHLATACCVLLTSAACLSAQEKTRPKTPEAFLSADCLAFVRYDGYDAHKKAYDQTALAKAMKDDLGEFLEHLAGFVHNEVV